MISVTELENRFDKLWPICRSILGPGIRESFEIVKSYYPFEIASIPTGTKVHDWEVPQEWHIHEAFIEDPDGNRIIDFKNNNLHVVSYSDSIDQVMDLEELKKNLYTRPELPDAIPYVTSYYNRKWGMCLSENQLKNMRPGNYRVCIKSEFNEGYLNYAHALLPATDTNQKEEIFLSSYLCHPSMANNELSGPLVLLGVLQELSSRKSRKYNYRFYIGPETIGAISYLSQHGEELKKNCVGGFVVTCCGDDGEFNYKFSRQGNARVDRAAKRVLGSQYRNKKVNYHSFFPLGSDERQYCSPGYNLPMGSVIRSVYGQYPEYHSSLDNKEFISFEAMQDSIQAYLDIIDQFENNEIYQSTQTLGEPKLDKYDLIEDHGGAFTPAESRRLLCYLLNYSDGQHDLLDIAEIAKVKVEDLKSQVDRGLSAGLLKKLGGLN